MVVFFSIWNLLVMFFDPTLTPELVSHNMTIAQSGLGFGCLAFWMLISSPIFACLFPKYGYRPLFFFCLVLSAVGIFFLGPSEIFGFSDNLYLIFIGLSLIGISMGGA
jgi:MFS family permease